MKMTIRCHRQKSLFGNFYFQPLTVSIEVDAIVVDENGHIGGGHLTG